MRLVGVKAFGTVHTCGAGKQLFSVLRRWEDIDVAMQAVSLWILESQEISLIKRSMKIPGNGFGGRVTGMTITLLDLPLVTLRP